MQKIRVFIPSYNRADTICTHKLFENNPRYEIKIVLHSEEQKVLYVQAKPEIEKYLVVSGVPNSENIGGQRRWIRSQIEQDEWYISCDDDIHDISSVVKELYNKPSLSDAETTKENFDRILTQEERDEMFDNLIRECESENIRFAGMASVQNIFFRKSNNQYFSFIAGMVMLEKVDKAVVLDPRIKIKEDTELTAQHLMRYGKVLKKNYLRPVSKFFAKGGVGSQESRRPLNEEVSKILIEEYSGLFGYRRGDLSEITNCIRGEKNIMLWRLKMILKGKLEPEYAVKILGVNKGEAFIKKYGIK